MNTSSRQNEVIEMLTARGECSVGFLARRLQVSGMTIRRDLRELAAAGRVVRTHGGATLAQRISFEFQFLNRAHRNQEAKLAIAAAAAELVRDGDSVIIDSGTTTLALAARLKERKDLTVITTSLPIVSELQFCSNVQVLLLGGLLRHGTPDLVGTLTETNLEHLRADVAFLGADAVDSLGHAYIDSIEVGRILTRMAASAERTYAVADSSKLGQTALMHFGDAGSWEGLITDEGIHRSLATDLRRAGVRVIKAGNGRDRTR
ncbi:MAG TPA: DeoR/GlpR family DNA-binding transcription regulator [Phycisphaerae bacterium]|nr:DeoR/GlpR family DNA-binding transcription regulator [Phycisphaerae bacterium]HRY68365.1 DeoR/GlpR family DNA-binding transcription regulator [Phycisphaerae bacterium]HSA28302.1 DeoR/GlpR family DNA-binding transcription regulator [Phycisphaerae bacterium]